MFIARKPQGKSVVTRGGTENVEVEENFTALERARHFGTSKLSLQRLVFVNELVDTAHEIGYEATVTHLLPLVKQLAGDAEVLVRQSLVGHFGDLAGFLIQSDPERGYQKVVDDVLPVVSLLLTEKASEVRQGAADALTTLASHLRPGERGDQVLMTVIAMSHNNDDEDARGTAVQLLNSLAEALGCDLCQQFVGVGLVALCEDPAFRVRKATAASFAEVARVVGDDYVLRRLLPAFGSLVHDAHWGVRKAAAESLVGLAMSLKVESRKEPLVPMMNDLLKDTSRWVRMSALQQLGYFIASLEKAERVPEGLLTQYVEIIEQSKANPDAADISYHCAYTFAAVTRTMGGGHWTTLRAPFSSLCHETGSLCRDTQLKTRKAMAASMHIVAQTLGAELTEREVLPQFEALLQDAAAEVRQAALQNVANIIRVGTNPAAQKKVLKLLQGAMGKAESWRLRHLVASQLGAVCDALSAALGPGAEPDPGGGDESAYAPSATTEVKVDGGTPAKDLTWSVVVPLFLQLCGDGVAEVRDEAARATAKALQTAAPELFIDPCVGEGSSGSMAGSKPPLLPATSRLVLHLIRTFAHGRTFRSRMTYIRMCDSVIRESPLQVFTELFLRPLVRLAVDPVKNVRLCWATTVAPHIRKVGRLGTNPALVAAAYRMIKSGKDAEGRRVLEAAPLAELPEGVDLNSGGPESDLDESDKSEGWLPTEGGTGDGSGCSDVGVGEKEEQEEEERREDKRDEEAVSSVPPPQPPAPGNGASQSSASASAQGLVFLPSPRVDVAYKASSEQAASRPRPVAPAALSQLASSDVFGISMDSEKPPSPASPSFPPATGSKTPPFKPASPADGLRCTFDPVEDGLVEQREMERDMDSAFLERRLLREAEEADAEDPLASLATASAAIDAADPQREVELDALEVAAAPATKIEYPTEVETATCAVAEAATPTAAHEMAAEEVVAEPTTASTPPR